MKLTAHFEEYEIYGMALAHIESKIQEATTQREELSTCIADWMEQRAELKDLEGRAFERYIKEQEKI